MAGFEIATPTREQFLSDEDYNAFIGATEAVDEICVVEATPVADPTKELTSDAPRGNAEHSPRDQEVANANEGASDHEEEMAFIQRNADLI